MIVTLHRTGGMAPPPDDERLEVHDDGRYSVWRSVGWATQPPSAVGAFEGKLEDEDLVSLQAECAAARAAGPARNIPMPGSPIIQVAVGDLSAQAAAGHAPGGVWDSLYARLEALLSTSGAEPVAAVRLRLSEDGRIAILEHLGREPLRLDLAELSVRADLLDEGEVVDEAEAEGPELGEIEASPGWQLEIPLPHDWQPGETESVTAFARFAAYRGDERVEVSLQSAG